MKERKTKKKIIFGFIGFMIILAVSLLIIPLLFDFLNPYFSLFILICSVTIPLFTIVILLFPLYSKKRTMQKALKRDIIPRKELEDKHGDSNKKTTPPGIPEKIETLLR